MPDFKRVNSSAGTRGMSEGTIVGKKRGAALRIVPPMFRCVKGGTICLEAISYDGHREMTT